MFNSPVAVAIWDLFFNIRSNEIEDYFLEEFKVLTWMMNSTELIIARKDVWLNKVQDAVYRTEDFVDKIRSGALNDRLEATSKTKRSTLHNLPFWPKQKQEVKKEIRREAKKIVNEFKSLQMWSIHGSIRRKFSLKSLVVRRRHLMNSFIYWGNMDPRNMRNDIYQEYLQNDIERYKRLSTFFVADSEVFRRDRDEEAIIELLLSDDGTGERLSVIPIVAEGGMGKTTLARRVYDNHRVSEHFDLKAWAWLSGKGDFLQATKAIVESFTSRSCDLEELTSLQNRLYEECWSIFVKYAIGDERLNSCPELEDIGRQFVRKCSGVPLAVRTLGALLFNRLEANKKLGQLVPEWRTKLDEFMSNFPGLWYVLRLSYYDLPPRLKRCFAYCSIFPEGYEFEKDKLILLWMAEGLLPQIEGNLTPEEVGDYYFHE
nr:putative disease resistance rpp13-like protein 1 [Quercus suber]